MCCKANCVPSAKTETQRAIRHTVRIIPASDTRLIPDFYHIVLHLLLVLNLCFLIAAL